jgi:hypothetical protein
MTETREKGKGTQRYSCNMKAFAAMSREALAALKGCLPAYKKAIRAMNRNDSF